MTRLHEWENVETIDPRSRDNQQAVWRLRVPGGWIYRFGTWCPDQTGVFVPLPPTSERDLDWSETIPALVEALRSVLDDAYEDGTAVDTKCNARG